jgi:hypothetical protein
MGVMVQMMLRGMNTRMCVQIWTWARSQRQCTRTQAKLLETRKMDSE